MCPSNIKFQFYADNLTVKRRGRVMEGLPPPTSSIVAVAITGSRKSKHKVKWALEKFVPEGEVCFKLLHVRPLITRIPTPSK